MSMYSNTMLYTSGIIFSDNITRIHKAPTTHITANEYRIAAEAAMKYGPKNDDDGKFWWFCQEEPCPAQAVYMSRGNSHYLDVAEREAIYMALFYENGTALGCPFLRRELNHPTPHTLGFKVKFDWRAASEHWFRKAAQLEEHEIPTVQEVSNGSAVPAGTVPDAGNSIAAGIPSDYPSSPWSAGVPHLPVEVAEAIAVEVGSG